MLFRSSVESIARSDAGATNLANLAAAGVLTNNYDGTVTLNGTLSFAGGASLYGTGGGGPFGGFSDWLRVLPGRLHLGDAFIICSNVSGGQGAFSIIGPDHFDFGGITVSAGKITAAELSGVGSNLTLVNAASAPNATTTPSGPSTQKVWVAKTLLKRGTLLSPSMLVAKEVAPAGMENQLIQDPQQVANKIGRAHV